MSSTQHTDMNRDQEAPLEDSRSLSTEDTAQQAKISPAESFPQPPRRPRYSRRERWFVFTALIVAVVLVAGVAALVVTQLGQHPSNQVTPTPTAPVATVTPTPGLDTTPAPAPGVVLGPQKGPATVSNPTYWDSILRTQGTNRQVESVSFANILGNSTLQALVTLRHTDGNKTLDVYVFDKITSANPVQIFRLQGLIQGDAKISGYNSILTAEVDRNSTLNAGKNYTQWTQDLFREFAWNAGQGTLTQVAFPGIFPDLTRYQAEADQVNVSKGLDSWKNDAAQVAQRLAAQFLPWKGSLTTTVIGGGGAQDVYATVKVQETASPNPQQAPFINVKLSRLEGNTHNMWVAVAVENNTIVSIENIDARSQIDNPVRIEGKGSAFEAVIGQAYVLDHLYNDVGHAQVKSSGVGMGNTTYSTTVLYNTSFKDIQEGIVEVVEDNGGISSDPYSAVMVKVLLTPEPGVALGPLPGPDQAQKAAYWVPIIGLDTSKVSVGTVSFANMKGDPSLQALVPVFHSDGSRIVDIYVYDQITSAHPVQLFALQGLTRGGAIISGYSTILTAQVDPNSSVNKDKSEDQLTTDLYREFRWSEGAGIFVPTAFPGIFPDLTRYQAEVDQITVKSGQDPWKNDARQVAQRMAAQLLKWSPSAAATLVSGGSPQDVDAVVQVKSPNPGGMSIDVTLSRLEGNTSNMWVVVDVTSGNGLLTIKTPVVGDRLTSPATITGSGSAFEGVVGQAFVLDHLYGAIGQSQVVGGSNGKTTYSTSVTFTSDFQGGTQEGIVVVYMYSQADGSIATAAMQKVMLSA